MAEKEKNKIVVLEPCTPTVEELLKVVQQKGQADIERVSSSAEVVQLTAMYQPCMMVVCLLDNTQLTDRVNLLKKMENSLKKGLVKTMFVTPIRNGQLTNMITALGVTDFIQEPVPVRTMQFKANLQLKAVDTIRKQQDMKKAADERIVFKKSEAAAKAETNNANKAANARLQPALQLQQDSFLFKNSGVKKLGKKYVVEMEGPDPATGEWKAHEDKGNAQTSWRWVPKLDENGNPLSDAGEGWVHAGDKPEFKEASGKWQLSSEKPELSYQRKDGQKIAKKISTDEAGEVLVAEDSEAALANVQKNRALAKRQRERQKERAEQRLAGENVDGEAADAGLVVKAGEDGAGAGEEAGESLAQKALRKLGRERKRPGLGEAEGGAGEDSGDAADAEGEAAGEEDGAEPGSPAALARKNRDPKKKKALSPLDFLKQKKDALDRPLAGGGEEAEEEDAEGAAPLARRAREKRSREEEGADDAAAGGEEKGAGANAKSLALLARMKQRLGDGARPGSADDGAEEASGEIALGSDGAEEEDAEGSTPLARRGREKKARGEGTELPFSEDAAPEAEAGADPVARQARAKKKNESRRDLMAEIQARLNSPLPEDMPPEEEAALRKKFSLENRPDIKPKDLARKDRLDAVKRLKDRLDALSDLPEMEDEEAAPEATVHDLRPDEANTRSERGFAEEEKRGGIRAFDSEDAPAEEEAAGALRKKKKGDGARDKKDLFTDEANYLPAAELTPLGGAWESTDSYYVYLRGDVRYHAFDRLEDLLPLWTFEGSGVPELLDRTNQWRFYGPLPIQRKTAAEVPREVREFLLGLRDRLRASLGKEGEADPEREAEALRVAAEDAAAAAVEAARAEEDAPRTQAEGLEEAFAKRRKEKTGDDAFARLKGRLGDDASSTGDSIADGTLDDATKEKEAAELAEAASPERARKEAEPGEELSPEKKKADDANRARLDSLKNRLGNDDPSSPDPESAEADDAELGLLPEEEAPADERAETAPATEAEAKPREEKEGSYAAAAMEKLKQGSPAFEKFLERRKQKAALEAAAAPAPTKAVGPEPGPAPAGPSAYLGIYVALSNSFGVGVHRDKALVRVLKSIALSFGHCSVAFVHEPDEESMYRVDQVSGEGLNTGDRVSLADGFAAAVRAPNGGEILGYLFLKPEGERTAFLTGEEAAATKAGELLWPLLAQARAKDQGDQGKAAA